MREKAMISGMLAAAMVALALGGCSSVSELPYPKLSEIVPASGPTLSPEERAAMIEDLKKEQQTHKDAAAEDIEAR